MRRSPRRPLILKRRKLPFQHNDQLAAVSLKEPEETPQPPAGHCFSDGIHIMDHPSMLDTQVVVIPTSADLQSVIEALTAKGKEHGADGPNTFIVLSGSGSLEVENDSFQPSFELDIPAGRVVGQPEKIETTQKHHNTKALTGCKPRKEPASRLNKGLDCSPLDDSLTNIQWLGRMSTDGVGPDHAKSGVNKENHNPSPEASQVLCTQMTVESSVQQHSLPERPPYSYMAMIQFAINSRKNQRMTLKDIYTWIEEHFPYFRQQSKPGWKNSIRHNLSLHDMFTRETSLDGKVSYWTIRPEANRCLTLDQIYKPGCEPSSTHVPVPRPLFIHQEQTRILPASRSSGSARPVRRMKPLLPRTDSYLLPIQLPTNAGPSVYLPPAAICSSYSPQLHLPDQQRKRVFSRGSKRVRIAPKVAYSDAPPAVVPHPVAMEIKEEPVCTTVTLQTPRRDTRGSGGGGGSSRRKQRLVLAAREEPVLHFPDSTFFDSGVASDASTFQDTQQGSPSRELSFKTPVKGGGGCNIHLASSTPSKPPGSGSAPEPWKVTPLGKGGQAMLDFSPIRTPSGPAHTPQYHDYTPLSFSSTPFKDLLLFSSPWELLAGCRPHPAGSGDSPSDGTQANRSMEGLMLDTMSDSLSKVLVDISFTGLEDDDMGVANISWSELIPQML